MKCKKCGYDNRDWIQRNFIDIIKQNFKEYPIISALCYGGALLLGILAGHLLLGG